MGSFYRKPEEVRLDLGDGEWLLVRKYLTAGEERRTHKRVMKANPESGRFEADLEQLGIAEIIAYLIDWSITDVDDKPIRILDAPYDFVYAALGNMDSEGYKRIVEALKLHVGAMALARDQEKKVPDGVSVP
jgi:hypothetical protein